MVTPLKLRSCLLVAEFYKDNTCSMLARTITFETQSMGDYIKLQFKLTFTLQTPFPDPPLAPTLRLTPKPRSPTTRHLPYDRQHLLLTEIRVSGRVLYSKYHFPFIKGIIGCDAFRNAVLGLSHLRRLVFCLGGDDAKNFVKDENIAEKQRCIVKP